MKKVIEILRTMSKLEYTLCWHHHQDSANMLRIHGSGAKWTTQIEMRPAPPPLFQWVVLKMTHFINFSTVKWRYPECRGPLLGGLKITQTLRFPIDFKSKNIFFTQNGGLPNQVSFILLRKSTLKLAPAGSLFGPLWQQLLTEMHIFAILFNDFGRKNKNCHFSKGIIR